MQSPIGKSFFMMKREANEFSGSGFMNQRKSAIQEPIGVSSSEDDDDDDDSQDVDASKQLVLYDPAANGSGAIEPVQPPQHPRFSSSKVLPSIGAFTVQCASCFKWRLIPTKEKYEEIREHILENPFVCETARAWRPDISCDDPTDISQDGSRLWAIDKPNIAQPPPGWQRLLRIRGEGSSKFADIYYQAPSGKRLRSMVEVQRYLMEHPEYTRDGVTLSQFSFQIPKPLQADYVRKRPRLTLSHDKTTSLEPAKVNPLAWAGPDDTDLQLGPPALPPLCIEGPLLDHRNRPVKQARRTLAMSSRNPEGSA